MSIFAVCSAAVAVALTGAYESGKLYERRLLGLSKDCLPFRNYDWTSQNARISAGVLFAIVAIELLLFPKSWNPFWYIFDSSNDFSYLRALTVFGSWSGILVIGYGGIVTLYKGLKDEWQLLETAKSEHHKSRIATEKMVEEETLRVWREMKVAVASAAAAGGMWRQLNASKEQHNKAVMVSENERIWSKTLCQQLDKKTISIVDNAMDKRWRDVEHRGVNLEEMRQRNLEKEKNIKEKKAQRAELVNAQHSQLEDEREKLKILTNELNYLRVNMEKLKEENMKKEETKINELKDREMALKAKEEDFEQRHHQNLEKLNEKEIALRSREVRFESGEERQELLRKSQKLESSMVNVAKFKKEIEIDEKAKLEEIKRQETALLKLEEKLKEIANNREIELEEHEEELNEIVNERQIMLAKREEELNENANRREIELAKREEELKKIANRREIKLAKREQELKEIASRQKIALKKRAVELKDIANRQKMKLAKREEELKEIANIREMRLKKREEELKEKSNRREKMLKKRQEELEKKATTTIKNDGLVTATISLRPKNSENENAANYTKQQFYEEGPEDEVGFENSSLMNDLSIIVEERSMHTQQGEFELDDDELSCMAKKTNSGNLAEEAEFISMQSEREDDISPPLCTREHDKDCPSEEDEEPGTMFNHEGEIRKHSPVVDTCLKPSSLLDFDEDDDEKSNSLIDEKSTMNTPMCIDERELIHDSMDIAKNRECIEEEEPSPITADMCGNEKLLLDNSDDEEEAETSILDNDEGNEEEVEHESTCILNDNSEYETTGIKQGVKREDENECPSVATNTDMKSNRLQSDETRELVEAKITTTKEETERTDNNSSRNSSSSNNNNNSSNTNSNHTIFECDSEDDSLSQEIQRDIAKKNRVQELDLDCVDPVFEEFFDATIPSVTSPLQEIFNAIKGQNANQRLPFANMGAEVCDTSSYKKEIPVSPTCATSASSNMPFKDDIPKSPTAAANDTNHSFKGMPSIAQVASNIFSLNYNDKYDAFFNKVEENIEKENDASANPLEEDSNNNIDDNNIDESNINNSNIKDIKIDESNIKDSSIDDSSIDDSSIEESSIDGSNIDHSKMNEINIKDSSIDDNKIDEINIKDSSMDDNKIDEINIKDSSIDDDSKIDEINIKDSSIDGNKIDEINIKDSSSDDSKIDEINVKDSSIDDSKIDEINIKDGSIDDNKIDEINIKDSSIEDSKIDSKIHSKIHSKSNGMSLVVSEEAAVEVIAWDDPGLL